ncbi:acyl dehydratase [Bacillus iocasae]|uniref:Acyl dehydratase n=2 Tax=Priestia iocasae TaxID=2291674 RepID=A0ABS2QPU5_9BACI|nr:MaoC/PaaZ C-terminal domain-containing protein [Metabacillus iocasae]MBM7701238.1 acyl dehydratase [Metabacillus iocasae]
MLFKKRKLGRSIDEITIGEKLTLTERIEDKDLLLYLGLTNDANPLYIQHDYASQTPLKRPIVPAIMITGMMTAAISKYLPGPGCHILKQTIEFPKRVYHYGTVEFLFKVIDVNHEEHVITIDVQAKDEEEHQVVKAQFVVCPPYKVPSIEEHEFENF